jgi:hypothetical protein
MTKQHKATPYQWEYMRERTEAGLETTSCILELRSRIEALESAQNQPAKAVTDPTWADTPAHASSPVDWVATDAELCKAYNEKTALRDVYDLGRQHGAAPIRSGPESPLVERVADAIAAQATSAGIVNDRPARAAILEVAAWLREQGTPASGWAMRLESEAEQ